jgi:hypothetical protein
MLQRTARMVFSIQLGAVVLLRGFAATEGNFRRHSWAKIGAGNGIRTRDFDLGKVALYH